MARNSVKLRSKEPRFIRSQPNYPILNEYLEQSPGRAINFDSFYNITTFSELLYYKHQYFLFGVIAFVRFPITFSKMATILHCGRFNKPSACHFNFIFVSSTRFYKNFAKAKKK